MTQLASDRDSHQSNFKRFEREVVTASQPWLDGLRKSAMARFEDVGFPNHKKDEEWRFTSVEAIKNTKFALAARIEDASSIEAACVAMTMGPMDQPVSRSRHARRNGGA